MSNVIQLGTVKISKANRDIRDEWARFKAAHQKHSFATRLHYLFITLQARKRFMPRIEFIQIEKEVPTVITRMQYTISDLHVTPDGEIVPHAFATISLSYVSSAVVYDDKHVPRDVRNALQLLYGRIIAAVSFGGPMTVSNAAILAAPMELLAVIWGKRFDIVGLNLYNDSLSVTVVANDMRLVILFNVADHVKSYREDYKRE